MCCNDLHFAVFGQRCQSASARCTPVSAPHSQPKDRHVYKSENHPAGPRLDRAIMYRVMPTDPGPDGTYRDVKGMSAQQLGSDEAFEVIFKVPRLEGYAADGQDKYTIVLPAYVAEEMRQQAAEDDALAGNSLEMGIPGARCLSSQVHTPLRLQPREWSIVSLACECDRVSAHAVASACR